MEDGFLFNGVIVQYGGSRTRAYSIFLTSDGKISPVVTIEEIDDGFLIYPVFSGDGSAIFNESYLEGSCLKKEEGATLVNVIGSVVLVTKICGRLVVELSIGEEMEKYPGLSRLKSFDEFKEKRLKKAALDFENGPDIFMVLYAGVMKHVRSLEDKESSNES